MGRHPPAGLVMATPVRVLVGVDRSLRDRPVVEAVLMHNIADETGVRVMRVRCSTCIFEPGNRMELSPGRVRDMVDSALAYPDAGTIVCHDTLGDKKNAICRGFFDRYRDDVQLVQIACRIGAIILFDREP